MCGFAGFVSLSKEKDVFEFANNHSEKILKQLSKRGPDGSGIFLSENKKALFYHTKLAITDDTEHSNQPMHSGQFSMVYNGEIYNKEYILTKYLAGYLPKTTSDSEIIIEAFARHGEKIIKELEGFFALAIWDNGSETLFLAKDHLGIKPLYFFQDKNMFAFSSSAKLLSESLNLKEKDLSALQDFELYGCVTNEKTIFKQIKNFPAANLMIMKKETFELKKYIKFCDTKPTLNQRSLKSVFEEVFLSQVQPNKKFGIFLSGGVDSNLIALCAKHLGFDFYTFTIGFEGRNSRFGSEHVIAKKFANKIQSQHVEWILGKEEIRFNFKEFSATQEMPSDDGFNSFLAAKLASKYCKIAYSGIGGDELFFGYWQNKHQARWRQFLQLPNYAQRKIHMLVSKIKNIWPVRSLLYKISASFLESKQLFDSELESYLFFREKKHLKRTPCAELEEIFNSSLNYWQKIILADLYFYDQFKLLRDTDNMSMNFGLEVRTPFLDKRMISFALQNAAQKDIKDIIDKQDLKKLILNYDKSFDFQKKQGFNIPLSL